MFGIGTAELLIILVGAMCLAGIVVIYFVVRAATRADNHRPPRAE
ncbi:MAG: hypothetical protein SGI77_12965 [Pirellulaceae bacterium]|nr:hypothetical protein [Pirellulaceae bacterium]